jgi:hypothetical protein
MSRTRQRNPNADRSLTLVRHITSTRVASSRSKVVFSTGSLLMALKPSVERPK